MAKEDEARATSLCALSSRFISFDFFSRGKRGAGGSCVNGVSTYSRSEVQTERKLTTYCSKQTCITSVHFLNPFLGPVTFVLRVTCYSIFTKELGRTLKIILHSK